jgi:hypothetical protein
MYCLPLSKPKSHHHPQMEKLNSELLSAAQRGDLPTVQGLVTKGVDATMANKSGHTALLRAAMHGRLEMVQWLVTSGGSRVTEHESFGRTALLWAALVSFHPDTPASLALETVLRFTTVTPSLSSCTAVTTTIYTPGWAFERGEVAADGGRLGHRRSHQRSLHCSSVRRASVIPSLKVH